MELTYVCYVQVQHFLTCWKLLQQKMLERNLENLWGAQIRLEIITLGNCHQWIIFREWHLKDVLSYLLLQLWINCQSLGFALGNYFLLFLTIVKVFCFLTIIDLCYHWCMQLNIFLQYQKLWWEPLVQNSLQKFEIQEMLWKKRKSKICFNN